jgi:hypothetical protein
MMQFCGGAATFCNISAICVAIRLSCSVARQIAGSLP